MALTRQTFGITVFKNKHLIVSKYQVTFDFARSFQQNAYKLIFFFFYFFLFVRICFFKFFF